jgi:hypothetical protein
MDVIARRFGASVKDDIVNQLAEGLYFEDDQRVEEGLRVRKSVRSVKVPMTEAGEV